MNEPHEYIPTGSVCSCGKPATAWHPHIGRCCNQHLQEVLDKASEQAAKEYFGEIVDK